MASQIQRSVIPKNVSRVICEVTWLHIYDSLDRQSLLQSTACGIQTPNLACAISQNSMIELKIWSFNRDFSPGILFVEGGKQLLWGFRTFGKA